jgi:hypothetical protein
VPTQLPLAIRSKLEGRAVPSGLGTLGDHRVGPALRHEHGLLDGRDRGDRPHALFVCPFEQLAGVAHGGAQHRHPLFENHLKLLL